MFYNNYMVLGYVMKPAADLALTPLQVNSSDITVQHGFV